MTKHLFKITAEKCKNAVPVDVRRPKTSLLKLALVNGFHIALNFHPASLCGHRRRPRDSPSGREKRRDESIQARAEKPLSAALGTDCHRTISKRSSKCWLLIGHKKCFVILYPIGEQHRLIMSSFCVLVHDGYCLAVLYCTCPVRFTKVVRARETFIFY